MGCGAPASGRSATTATGSRCGKALADKFLNDKAARWPATLALESSRRGLQRHLGSRDETADRGYDVQVSVDGGAWTPLADGTPARAVSTWARRPRLRVPRPRDGRGQGYVSAWDVDGLPVAARLRPGRLRPGRCPTRCRTRGGSGTAASIWASSSTGDAARGHRRPGERRRLHVVPRSRGRSPSGAGRGLTEQRVGRGAARRRHSWPSRRPHHDGRRRLSVRLRRRFPRRQRRGHRCRSRSRRVARQLAWTAFRPVREPGSRARSRSPGAAASRPDAWLDRRDT